MKVWIPIISTFAVLLLGTAFVIGYSFGASFRPLSPLPPQPALVYTHGFQSQDFFDRAYDKASKAEALPLATAILSAHHLLVADEIARVFESLKENDGQTVVMVGPNHFHRGTGPAQVSFGSWETPYGQVNTDTVGANKLFDNLPFLKHDEVAFPLEHGIAGLTPFVARSLPNSKVISIILEDRLSAEDAWTLGQQISTILPDAVLVASVDMVHESSESRVAKYDPQIISTLEQGCSSTGCFEDYPIDSNASLRTLLSFAHARGLAFKLTHEGSSIRMGIAKTAADNVSHILGMLYSE